MSISPPAAGEGIWCINSAGPVNLTSDGGVKTASSMIPVLQLMVYPSFFRLS